jgi:hypothetical protein
VDAEAASTRRSRRASATRAFWRQPIFWLLGIFVSAAGVAISNWLVPQFTEVLEQAEATGDPLAVSDVLATTPRTVWLYLPANVRLTESVLRELNESSDSQAWLKNHGAVAPGSLHISIVLSGNWPDKVRIVDIKPRAECSDASMGAWFGRGGLGGVDRTLRLDLVIDDSNPTAMIQEGGRAEPFFPAQTLSLEHEEQQVILINAYATESVCTFDLEFTVVYGQSRITQTITNNGKPFFVAADPQEEPRNVYAFNETCGKYLENPPVGSDSLPRCVPGK